MQTLVSNNDDIDWEVAVIRMRWALGEAVSTGQKQIGQVIQGLYEWGANDPKVRKILITMTGADQDG